MPGKGGGDELERLFVKIGFEVDENDQRKIKKDIDDVGTTAKKSGEEVARSAEKAQQTIGTRAVAMGNLVSAGIQKATSSVVGLVGEVVGRLKEAVQGFADFGSEIADTSNKLGTGVEELQRLRYAAKQSGVETSALDGALRTMQKGSEMARVKGTGPFVEGLAMIGVRLRELKGLNAEDRFKLLADAVSQVGDENTRTAAAMKLFGGSGSEILPFLNQGADGIDKLTKRASELGLVLDQEAIDKADALGDSLDDLDAVIAAAGVRIGGELAPLVTEAATGITEWIAENQQFVRQDFPAALSAIVSTGADLLVWLADVITEFQNFGELVVDTGEDLAAMAKTIEEELQPVIDVVVGITSAWANAFVAVNTAIGEGIAKVLDYIGVLDTLREVWNKLPFVGENIDELTDRLHGGSSSTRGPASFLTPENEKRRQAEQGVRIAKQINDAIAIANAETTNKAIADAIAGAGGRPKRRAYKPPKPGGGGGGAAKDTGITNEDIWKFATGQSEPSGFASVLGGIGSALGLGGGKGPLGVMSTGGGGGSSPLSGAVFNRVDASFTQTLNFDIALPEGLANAAGANLAGSVAREVVDQIAAQNRPVFEHYQQVVRGL